MFRALGRSCRRNAAAGNHCPVTTLRSQSTDARRVLPGAGKIPPFGPQPSGNGYYSLTTALAVCFAWSKASWYLSVNSIATLHGLEVHSASHPLLPGFFGQSAPTHTGQSCGTSPGLMTNCSTVLYPFPSLNSLCGCQSARFENDFQYGEEFCNDLDVPSEARAVYLCSGVDGDTQEEAVIKIRMQ